MNNVYTYSKHYRENALEEVEAALFEGRNSPDSVRATYEARLENELHRNPVDMESIQRINDQLEYVGLIALQGAEVA